ASRRAPDVSGLNNLRGGRHVPQVAEAKREEQGLEYPPPRSPGRGTGRYPVRPTSTSASQPTRVSDARWEPRRDPRPPTRPRTRRAPGGLIAVKVLLAILSLLVLVAAGYYRNTLDEWSDGMTRQDVIANKPSENPADGAIDILMVGMDSRTD